MVPSDTDTTSEITVKIIWYSMQVLCQLFDDMVDMENVPWRM
jgi:hypothetical protein